MDLGQYSLEDLILSALKSEVDAKVVYSTLADGVRNAYLKGRLRFLADEEEKHRRFLDDLFRTQFPGREPVLPEATPVPLPEVNLPTERVPISSVFSQAMAAEKAASEFYAEFADRFEEGTETHNTLKYFSKMEMGHYSILDTEKAAATTFEEFDEMWPMMHAGP